MYFKVLGAIILLQSGQATVILFGCFSTTSGVASLGGSTSVTCSAAVLFDLFVGRDFACGVGSVTGSICGSSCSVCVV
ncbi:MAG: hypothetical protein ACKPKO_36325 [Candidatus Fonsibacter sp.]